MDREKVLTWLEICGKNNDCSGCCPYSENGDGQCRESLMADAYDMLKEQEAVEDALALLKKQRWIPVSERLPDVGQSVLVYAVGKIDGFIGEHITEICKRFVMRFLPSSPGHEVWSSPYQFFHTDYEITHWMPLPEMPKENNDNG